MKETGKTAYEARYRPSGLDDAPWDTLTAARRETWAKIEQAVIAEHEKPAPGWRELGHADPHGDRYNTSEPPTGKQFTDDQVAFRVAMACRTDVDLEATLCLAKDRIRWLSRRVVALVASLQGEAAEGSRMNHVLSLRQSTIDRLEGDIDTGGWHRLGPGEVPAYDRFEIWSPRYPDKLGWVTREMFAERDNPKSPSHGVLHHYTHWRRLILPGGHEAIGQRMDTDAARAAAILDAPIGEAYQGRPIGEQQEEEV